MKNAETPSQASTQSAAAWPRGAPRPSGPIITRPRFLSWMREQHAARGRLICGMAGAGKTSALIGWLQERTASDRRVIWVTLDAELRDRSAFWTLVLGHLRELGAGIDPELAQELRSPNPRRIAALLVRQFQADTGTLLVVDNGDLGAGSAIADDLIRLIEHVPSLQVVVTTRTAPGTSGLEERLGEHLAVCPPDHLLFDADEIAELAAQMGRSLRENDAEVLRATSNGWAIAIRAELAGPQGSMAPFTSLEVRLSAPFRRHPAYRSLVRLSLDEVITPAHRQALDLDPGTGELLEAVAAEGLGWWEDSVRAVFRLQPLLRRALRADIGSRFAPEAKDAYARLSDMQLARGGYAAAFDSALLAEDWHRASVVFRRHLVTITSRPTQPVLRVRNVPERGLRAEPILRFAVALDDFANGRRRYAVRSLARLMASIDTGRLPRRRISADDVWRQVVIAASQRMLNRHDLTRTAIRRLRHMMVHVDDPSREIEAAASIIYAQGALALVMAGELSEAGSFLDDAGADPLPARPDTERARVLAARALVSILQGDARAAARVMAVRAALDLPDTFDSSYSGIPSVLAEVHLRLERGDPDDAEELLLQCGAHAATTDLWPLLLNARVTARWQARGGEEALSLLDEALSAREGRAAHGRGTRQMLTVLRSRILLSMNRMREARAVLADAPNPRSRSLLPIHAYADLLEGESLRATTRAAMGVPRAATFRQRQSLAVVAAAGALRLDDQAQASAYAAVAIDLVRERGLLLPLTGVPRADLMRVFADAPDVIAGLTPFHRFPQPAASRPVLTAREQIVLRELVELGSIAAIADTLSVSQNTVKSQLRSVYRKLGADGRESALAEAHRHGLL